MTDNMYVPTGTVTASAQFLPTAVSYTAGNIVDVAKEFVFVDKSGLAVPKGSVIRILTAALKIDANALISGEAIYTAHGYSVTPPSARANNAAWARASADLPSFRGDLTIGTPVAAGGTCYVKTQFSDQQDFFLAAQSLWFELVNSGTFTGAVVARELFLYGILL